MEPEDPQAPLLEEPVTAQETPTAAIEEGASEMSKKKAKKASAKQKSDRKPRATKQKRDVVGRVLKTYRLVDDAQRQTHAYRDGSAAMAIIDVIKKLGAPTGKEIAAALPKSFKSATLGFYLGKFQTEKIVTTKTKK